jgi:hypothetical protein
MQVSQWAGSHLYDAIGFEWLVLISTVTTALTWLLVPLVRIEGIEVRARGVASETTGA